MNYIIFAFQRVITSKYIPYPYLNKSKDTKYIFYKAMVHLSISYDFPLEIKPDFGNEKELESTFS